MAEWQTRTVQVRVGAIPCRFNSCCPHHYTKIYEVYMEFNTTLILIVGLVCYFALPPLIYFCIKQNAVRKIFLTAFFVLYVCVLLIGVLGKIDITAETTKITFDFSGEWAAKPINWTFGHLTTFDILINLFMLIPIGTYICLMRKNNSFVKIVFMCLFLGFIVGIFIETAQYILPIQRSVQLSDTIFNAVSVVLGGIYGFFVFKLKSKTNKK